MQQQVLYLKRLFYNYACLTEKYNLTTEDKLQTVNRWEVDHLSIYSKNLLVNTVIGKVVSIYFYTTIDLDVKHWLLRLCHFFKHVLVTNVVGVSSVVVFTTVVAVNVESEKRILQLKHIYHLKIHNFFYVLSLFLKTYWWLQWSV